MHHSEPDAVAAAEAREQEFDGLVRDFVHALEARQISAAFQPLVDVATGNLVAAEALARWAHPERGVIAPDVFVAAAETHGMLSALTERILSECSAWPTTTADGRPIAVAINVSASQLRDPSLYRMLDAAFTSGDLDPHTLTLEVTEGERLADSPPVAPWLAGIIAAGVTVSVDDFGIGHSSFRRVEQLGATELKIDRSLVQDVARADTLARVVQEAHDLGLRVVGEGVEHRSDYDRLAAVGCDRAQGFWIARPAPREQFTRWARQHASIL
ncbi:EAL domain-containing protein [Leifsonia sp. F6_8S_P_1B]|uniref:EAL domain-containing protein n=1 Tax=Leifsonia williamsii TaxID=3035919 RepID=A0ABT8K8V2_9MICO|nr:EAL domain-containing protein [Leifsonia williamsii]MDN4613246.1 EAL domain-containing protein [Leifsonia williamsii]